MDILADTVSPGYFDWELVVIVISLALDILWARVIPLRSFYYVIRAPGVIVHECSHILGCLITGAKVKKVVFFSERGGFCHLYFFKNSLSWRCGDQYCTSFLHTSCSGRMHVGVFAVSWLCVSPLAHGC